MKLIEFEFGSDDLEICTEHLEYLERTANMNIKAIGRHNETGEIKEVDFGYPHRYTEEYLKGRYKKLYALDEWLEEQLEIKMTFLSFTIRHNYKSKYEMHNVDQRQAWFRDGFETLQEGKRLILMHVRKMYPKIQYVMICEPHEDGYPHYHMLIFTQFKREEITKLKNMWLKYDMGSIEHGLKFQEIVDRNIKGIRNYLMKYMLKSLPTYKSKYGDTTWTKSQWLFNAVAWKYHFRTWFASNELSHIMRKLPPREEPNITWNRTEMDGYIIWNSRESREEYVHQQKLKEYRAHQ
jgi:hypothetical protein